MQENAETANVGGVTGERLKSLIERIERVTEEKDDLANDIKEIFQESKSAGFDVATMKQIIKLRKLTAEKRQEAEALLETYLTALGI